MRTVGVLSVGKLTMSVRTFSFFTLNLHPHTALRYAPLAQCSCDRLYSCKIKKCEFEAEREVNPHTQSPHSHSLMWAHQGMILGPPDYESGALTN